MVEKRRQTKKTNEISNLQITTYSVVPPNPSSPRAAILACLHQHAAPSRPRAVTDDVARVSAKLVQGPARGVDSGANAIRRQHAISGGAAQRRNGRLFAVTMGQVVIAGPR
uniref:(northern house mosquito) hypothetical protein n=1 Tax=Culex pipiens TaxID=7175 RepID=A0A8D7ZVD8_CULPI